LYLLGACSRDVRVHGDERVLITRAKGLAGRGVEIPEASFGKGGRRTLQRDVLAVWIAGQPLFAAVSRGNARALRAFLAAGFRPVRSEVPTRHFVGLGGAHQRRARAHGK